MTERYDDLSEYNWLMSHILDHETPQALALGALLYARLQPKSVLDVGCGPGIYLVPFKERGCRVYGVDGAPGGGKSLDPSEFELADLRNGWTPKEKFDLALCIEVAEHMKEQYAEGLVKILSDASDVVYFSAARPGQGGENHVNEQPQSYWKSKFGLHGFRDHPLDGEIRQSVNADPVYDHCHWLRWNGMLLGR